MSLADAKLARQHKRNEAADAALSATASPLDKRQVWRTKSKWKPFDFANDGGGGVPVSETRVNTYSHTSSLSRPVSALSHHTASDSGRSEVGFQQYPGRKGRRQHPFELRAYATVSDAKQQTTVEAAFDQREMYEVFGNALPGPEFLEQNTGFKNGQVQFLQHPNGDVSAQQWSAERFEWANLGQFSNIRKKVEGQLASDRLKGETAYHTLQQNTLQYFRTIAKQREAMAMGLPFGPKDVQAAMPATALNYVSRLEKDREDVSLFSHPTQSATAPNVTQTTAPGGLAVQRMDTLSPSTAQHQFHTHTQAPATAHQARSPLPPGVPKEPAALRWEVTGALGGVRASDAFNTPTNNPATTSTIHGHRSLDSRPLWSATNYGSSSIAAHMPHRVSHYYQIPPAGTSSHAMQSPGAQKYFADRAAIADRMQSQWRQVYGNSPSMNPYGQGTPSYRAGGTSDQHASWEARTPYHTATYGTEIIAPQPKSINSFDRSAMRHTLYKLGETAKERNLSQANIRTVLHDPFHSPSTVERADPGQTVAQKFDSPLRNSTVAGSTDETQKRQSPLIPPVRDQRRAILQHSSPDTQWIKRPYEHSTPLLARSTASQAPLQAAHSAEPHSQAKALTTLQENEEKKTYEDQLSEWWMNRSTFARQEDLYQTIVGAHAAQDEHNSPRDHPTPIGFPSCNTASTAHDQSKVFPFNETTTRLLIPVWDSLASYVQGPAEKRRDYWCPWGPAPEWCIDRSPEGNQSFFETDWSSPPQRIVGDPRYAGSGAGSGSGDASKVSRGVGEVGAQESPSLCSWQEVDRRFAHVGRS